MVTAPERHQVYTTGDIARLCHVTKRTVIKWIDQGRLRGFRIPGSTHRRVAAADLAAFLKKHRLPEFEKLRPRGRILIVDDDPDFAELLVDALSETYDVQVARSALDAAGRLPAFGPDLVLLDVRLPDVSGLDVCRHFQPWRRAGRGRIVVMSAYGAELDLAEVRRSGADDFMAKPVRLADLRRRVKALVG